MRYSTTRIPLSPPRPDLLLALAAALALGACSGETSAAADDISEDSTDVAPQDGGGSDTATAEVDDSGPVVDRGPTTIPIEGDPNGLWWDDASQTLYLADDNGNRILRWTDAEGLGLVADLPSPSPDGAGLGQLVRLADGSLVVTRFGFGTTGDVAVVTPSGATSVVPNLDPQRRRIGLGVSSEGQLYTSWFVRLESGDRAGAVGALNLAGTEVELIQGLSKPVGVLVVGDTLFVTEQDLGQVLRAPIASPQDYTVFATVEAPDLLAAGPSGSLLLGSAGGSFYRVDADGIPSVLATGFQQVRGVAYDPTNDRVFIADHDPDESDGVSHVLRIEPMP